MYDDTKPCEVCGSDIELRPRRAPADDGTDGPLGPTDGVVGGADATVDERVCLNPDCTTHRADGPDA